jgi:hypothetical protein
VCPIPFFFFRDHPISVEFSYEIPPISSTSIPLNILARLNGFSPLGKTFDIGSHVFSKAGMSGEA